MYDLNSVTIIKVDPTLYCIEKLLNLVNYEPGLYISSSIEPYTPNNKLTYRTTKEPVNVYDATNLKLDDIVDPDYNLILSKFSIENSGHHISNVPMFPVKTLKLLNEIFDLLQYQNNNHSELYYKDTLGLSGSNIIPYSITEYDYAEDIISNYSTLVSDIFNMLNFYFIPLFYSVLEKNKNSAYEFSYDNTGIYIKDRGDIRAVRYDMAIEAQSDNVRMDNEYKLEMGLS